MQRIDWNEGWMYAADGEKGRTVTLPHDAMQERGRSEDALSGQGGAWFRGGTYVYRKTFTAPDSWKDKCVLFETEGIYPNAKIRLNGKLLGRCVYGYSGYQFEMSSLRYASSESAGTAEDPDQLNTLEITVDHTHLPDSRWYSGGGMYRPVHLLIGDREAHLIPDSLKVTTLSLSPARIRVSAEHCGSGKVRFVITRGGHTVAEEITSDRETEMEIPDAALWSAEDPNLYTCEAQLLSENGTDAVDADSVRFGIRAISWSAGGLLVNGRQTLLKGGCIHHDNGILGARTFAESEYRRVSRMKKMGFNAIRSSHNPACRTLLDACDELGMYIMDEGWDMWYKPKNPHDYARQFETNWKADAKAMIDKDYSHPSVIMYSIGNEVTEPKERRGVELASRMVHFFHHYDRTRPVTCGVNITLLLLAKMGIDLTKSDNAKDKKNSGGENPSATAKKKEASSTDFNRMMSTGGERMNRASAGFLADRISSPVLDVLDIAGYNYASARYAKEGKKHPQRVIVGTETYPHKLFENWAMVKKYPWLIGDFMWTAWDYLGETGIGSWTWSDGKAEFDKSYPWLLADSGVFDILGNDNAEAGNAAVIWGARKTPYIAVMPVDHPWQDVLVAMWRGSNALPHWSYQGCEGHSAQVEVYANARSVRLYLNGRLVGEEPVQDGRAVFHPDYEQGELHAEALDEKGQVQGESRLFSASGTPRVRIHPEEKLTGDRIRYIDIDVTGENGEIECGADRQLSVQVDGAELLAFGSANPKTEDDYLSGSCRTYHGRAQAVIRTQGCPCIVKVTDYTAQETVSLVIEQDE